MSTDQSYGFDDLHLVSEACSGLSPSSGSYSEIDNIFSEQERVPSTSNTGIADITNADANNDSADPSEDPIPISEEASEEHYESLNTDQVLNHDQVSKRYHGILHLVDKSGTIVIKPEQVRLVSSTGESDTELIPIHVRGKPIPCFFTKLQKRCRGTPCK
ncbi:hypothetical protein HAX54_031507 [Datura stramonium]|uniref:Uncharacterized protein n=1 Tax=Datura stramonium TaxID=4076 RepID=A0ABS8RH93_DATST|nr:hypothetical protein [Datura stramonium]